jgi:hypothetical protein
LTGEQDVIGSNRLPHGFELGANGPGSTRIAFVEQRPLERTGKERFEPLCVDILALALRDALPQLESNDRREQHHTVSGRSALESPAHAGLGAVDQRDARVRIKQVRRHRRRLAQASTAAGDLPA